MEIILDVTFASGMLSAIFALIASVYLLNLWNNQSSRLMTDLPLVFGITFLFTALNMFLLTSVNGGFLPDTMELFRIRTFIIFILKQVTY